MSGRRAKLKQDLVQKDTLKYEAALKKNHVSYRLLNLPAGKERKLDYVFAVKFPKWPESRDVYQKMTAFFGEAESREGG